MTSAFIAKLGIIFLATGVCATFLMYWLWGFPFDKKTRTSAAPKPLMYTHRILGYIYVITYIAIMWHMVPRMWEYQIEFPARTVAHIILGITIGFLLVIKISIMRFFRHFEEWMPYLGTALLLCTVLLLGLSVPFVFQEQALAQAAPGGSAYSQQSIQRVSRLLPGAGFPEEANLPALATEGSLRDGREVLLTNCVKCHDLRTVLLRPRTPSNWYRTVARMGEKPALFAPLSQEQQWRVTAYLIAITPDLQRSAKLIRQQKTKKDAMRSMTREEDQDGVKPDAPTIDPETPVIAPGTEPDGKPVTDPAGTPPDGAQPSQPTTAQKTLTAEEQKAAEEAFNDQCSQCHELSDVDADPPGTLEEVDELLERMIENDWEVEPEDLELVRWYLREQYVNKK